jgi:hypothetical protein
MGTWEIRAGIGLLCLAVGSIAGCSAVDRDVYLLPEQPGSPGLTGELSRADATRIRRGQLAIEYSPDLDRVTFFGVHNGPSLVHTVGLDREPADDGSYTFFGGGYFWSAPQAGEYGWRNASGELQDWPPDPAMDAGPARIVGRSQYEIVTTNPVGRDGLRQMKTIGLRNSHAAEIEFGLENTGDETLRRAHWINTAVDSKSRIALKLKEGEQVAQIYANDPEAVEQFNTILGPIDERGWAMVNLASASFDGGIKIYTDGPAEIAIWVPNPDWLQTRGFWLHRRLDTPLTTEQRSELRAIGEGPVAVYINPGLGLIEAELYGPVFDIEPGQTVSSTEVWTVYEASSPRTFLMREERLLPARRPGFFEKH